MNPERRICQDSAELVKLYQRQVQYLQGKLAEQDRLSDSLEMPENQSPQVPLSHFELICSERNRLETQEALYKQKVQVLQDCVVNVSV